VERAVKMKLDELSGACKKTHQPSKNVRREHRRWKQWGKPRHDVLL